MAERWWQRLQPIIRPLRRLTLAQRALLCALAQGRTLKGHRYLNGRKTFRLYDSTKLLYDVADADVAALQRYRLLDSNMKFPAATFFLSARGLAVARAICEDDTGAP
jgi:hypothetical protein